MRRCDLVLGVPYQGGPLTYEAEKFLARLERQSRLNAFAAAFAGLAAVIQGAFTVEDNGSTNFFMEAMNAASCSSFATTASA